MWKFELFSWYSLNDCYFASGQADAKLKEEEKRALRYLETRRECNSVEAVSNFVIVYSLRLFKAQ